MDVKVKLTYVIFSLCLVSVNLRITKKVMTSMCQQMYRAIPSHICGSMEEMVLNTCIL